MLKAGADPNFNARSGVSPLQVSVHIGEVEFFGAALRYGGNPNIRDHNDEPASMIALGKDLKILEMLVKAGADVNAITGIFEISLLAKSLYATDFDATLWLIHKGADYKQENVKGKAGLGSVRKMA